MVSSYRPKADIIIFSSDTNLLKTLNLVWGIRGFYYDKYTTTDDHGMHIVGLAKDQNGKEYYMVKNSWGDANDYKGYLYVSKAFFKYKTTAVLVNKNAIPTTTLKKLK
jgi:bleomycin hydrolase